MYSIESLLYYLFIYSLILLRLCYFRCFTVLSQNITIIQVIKHIRVLFFKLSFIEIIKMRTIIVVDFIIIIVVVFYVDKSRKPE